jgi:hypothetical protein
LVFDRAAKSPFTPQGGPVKAEGDLQTDLLPGRSCTTSNAPRCLGHWCASGKRLVNSRPRPVHPELAIYRQGEVERLAR